MALERGVADTACLGEAWLKEDQLGRLHCDENVCTLEVVEKMELGGRKGEVWGLGGRS